MLQLRRNDPSRRRRIKRDLYNVPRKGVAGLRLNVQDEEIVREIRGAERPASPASDSMGKVAISEIIKLFAIRISLVKYKEYYI